MGFGTKLEFFFKKNRYETPTVFIYNHLHHVCAQQLRCCKHDLQGRDVVGIFPGSTGDRGNSLGGKQGKKITL